MSDLATELERVRRELEEAKEDADEWRSIDRGNAETISELRIKLAEARKAAFAEAAEIAGKLLTADLKPQQPGFLRGVGYAAQFIFDELRAKAEAIHQGDKPCL